MIIARNHKAYAWSDSTITLGWIENHKNKDKFIRNRVEEIQNLYHKQPGDTWARKTIQQMFRLEVFHLPNY